MTGVDAAAKPEEAAYAAALLAALLASNAASMVDRALMRARGDLEVAAIVYATATRAKEQHNERAQLAWDAADAAADAMVAAGLADPRQHPEAAR